MVMFGGIFLLILFLNLAKIRLNRPVELLHGNNTGEKEPKAKWLMALIGFVCLGIGYYLAITTESPISAISIFLLAVILVMTGTYLLFTAAKKFQNHNAASSKEQKKLLLQNRQFYQHLRHALPYETECGRSGKHLYFKYRRSVDDLHDGLHLLWHE